MPTKTNPRPGTLSSCETMFAVAKPWHLRKLTAKGYKFGGGADTPALCGRAVAWDVNVPVTKGRLSNSLTTCRKCLEVLNAE
jgi:hypothetical protein